MQDIKTTESLLLDKVGVVSHLFVCFPLYLDWTGLDEDEDAHVWEDNWDDDNVEDDFSNQLRYLNPLDAFCKPISFYWIIFTTAFHQ